MARSLSPLRTTVPLLLAAALGSAPLATAQNCVYVREEAAPAALAQFGSAVDAFQGWAVAGAPGASRVTVFRLTPNGPGPALYQPTQVLATPGSATGQFGAAVSMAGSQLLVGAPGEERAYLYTLDPGTETWSLSTVLEQPISGAGNTKFGFAVAVERNPLGAPHLFVGAFQTYVSGLQYAGAVHAYATQPSGALDAPVLVTHPAPGFQDRFGVSLDAAGGALAVGTPYDDTAQGVDAGSVQVFQQAGAGWSLVETLDAVSPGNSQYFGISLSLAGNPSGLCVGCENDASGASFQGAAHVYYRPSGTGNPFVLAASLQAPGGQALDDFGYAVTGMGNTWVIGARGFDQLRGAAFEYFVTGGQNPTVTLRSQYAPTSGNGGDLFGHAIALDDLGGLVVGAQGHRAAGLGGAGGTYFRVYSSTPTDCNGNGLDDACELFVGDETDLDGNGILDSCESTGSAFCTGATTNSTGAAGKLQAIGSNDLSANDLFLYGYDLPPNQFGMLLTSTSTGIVGYPGGSQGILCLTGSIGRFTPALISGAGILATQADFNDWPNNGMVLPGQTWSFQYWHRDQNPGVTSNFTSAWSVTF